jgi:putative ATP-dependent endonuclease of OLD family
MKLTRLHIQNFRGIKDLTIALDRDITVLIGENNSGKTSILEALRLGLAQIKSSKICNFSDYDFHRDNMKDHISRCEEIRLTYSWEESKKYPWAPEISQVLNEIIVGEEYARINLRVTARYDEENKELKQEWNFLDGQENIFTTKQNFLKDLQKIRPLFFLSTLRDVKEEFRSKATFWSSFLKIKDIDKTTREKLEKELDKINRKIVESQQSFKDVEKEIEHLSEIISAGKTSPVTVEPAAPDILNSLQHAQVNLLTENNVKIPLANHGSGTQSLSVLLLFSAYLKTRLAQDIDKLAEPIIAIEEPEAHLHPNAVRALWNLLQALPGQKIIATHSGDILSEIPLHYLRRIKKEGDNTRIYSLPEPLLGEEEIRKFTHHVRRNRGELLFARCWLLVEGETEVTVITAAAELMGKNLSRFGIRLVEYSQAGGPGIFIKAADSLSIQWHTVADNDDSGNKSVKTVEKLLKDKNKNDYLTQLDSPNMDILLCQSGYEKPYLDGLPAGIQQSINAPAGSIDYWKQVYKNLPNKFSKPAAAFEAISLMKAKGKSGIPPQICDIINKAIQLAEV